MKTEKVEALRAELARTQQRVTALEAQLASRLGDAFDALPKTRDYHGSAVLLTVTKLSGEVIVPPVAIRDGLSLQSIQSLQQDMRLSFEIATLVNPTMALTS